ncbi:glycosyltransferase [Candidatus Woesearchaeota archaeon]|nr:glycosyltransferase [Candidatus Woesearchaeota archaeon]
MDENMLVSVVIPCYNSARHIEPCLNSIVQQKVPFQYEVIVVDSSTDETPKIVQEKFPSVQLIHLDLQTYPGAGRNIGAKEAQGKILAFIDSDCVASGHWLQTVVESMHQGYSFVGGAVRNGNPGLISHADFILTFNEFMEGMPRREVRFMPTCNFVCYKDDFHAVGGFDPAYPVGEDTLFCYAAAQKYKLLFNPALIAAHTNRDTLSAFLRHQYYFGKHSAALRKKIKLLGAFLAKFPVLALLAPFVRVGRIGWRIFRWNMRKLPLFIVVLPFIGLGAGAWGWGFMREAFR